MRIRGRFRLLVVSLTLGVAACGGGGAEDEASDKRLATTSTLPENTTTTISAEAAASEAAVIKLSDLGDPWKENSAAEGVAPSPPESCMTKAGIYADLADDSRYEGATFQRGDAQQRVQSTAISFPSEEKAEAMTRYLVTEAYAVCEAERSSAQVVAAPGAAEGASYRADKIQKAPEGGGNGGFAGAVQYQYQALVGGKLKDGNGRLSDLLYRNGRTVLFVTTQYVVAEGDPENLFAVLDAEVFKASSQAIARASR